mmetsp:Transcript_26262/g.65273  ORF Transcript_26262/g.65273 Transcript_26262/m.65273 type:complete len:148 (-) Transcript_26262:109-552(-)
MYVHVHIVHTHARTCLSAFSRSFSRSVGQSVNWLIDSLLGSERLSERLCGCRQTDSHRAIEPLIDRPVMSTEQQEGGAAERVPLLGGLLGGGLTSTFEWFPRSKGMAGWDVRESCVLIGLLQLVVAFIFIAVGTFLYVLTHSMGMSI